MEQLNNRINKEMCCGCMACKEVCPVGAIRKTTDYMGFTYPVIDESMCTECGRCNIVCKFPLKNKGAEAKKILCVTHCDHNVIINSRSGGVFTAVSDYVLEQGGSVYGAFLDEGFRVEHKRAITKEERDKFRKSKYVQSDLDKIYKEILRDLGEGRYVLFSGTPCQCDAVKSYIEISDVSDNRLYICDIVCHSAASPELFEKYIDYQSKKEGSNVVAYDFRDKEKYNWVQHVEKIVFDNGTTLYTDEYTNLYFSNDIRPACFNCKYTSLNRVSDITLGDCWGGEKRYPEIIEKGASLLMINTDKGMALFNKVKNDLVIREIDVVDVMQNRLSAPAGKSEGYDAFWDDYAKLNMREIIEKYSYNSYKEIDDFMIINSFNDSSEIVLWGTGGCFRSHLADVLSVCEVKYVCDNNPTKWGKMMSKDIFCINPDELKNLKNPFVIIMIEDIRVAFRIARQLINMGIYQFDIFYNWKDSLQCIASSK